MHCGVTRVAAGAGLAPAALPILAPYLSGDQAGVPSAQPLLHYHMAVLQALKSIFPGFGVRA